MQDAQITVHTIPIRLTTAETRCRLIKGRRSYGCIGAVLMLVVPETLAHSRIPKSFRPPDVAFVIHYGYR